MSHATKVKAKTRVDKALRRLVTRAAQDFGRHLKVVMTSDQIEGPHKARVALRHLRATLTAFCPVLHPSFHDRVMHQLRAHATLIGRQRDADVLAAALNLPDLIAAAAALRPETRAALKRDGAKAWAKGLPERFAAKDWYRKSTKVIRHGPTRPLAAVALTKIWARARACGPDLTRLDDDARHDLRKTLKTLRYMTDQFALIWPGPARDGFLALLAALQEDLGLLNDLVIARSRGLAVACDPDRLTHAQGLWHSLQSAPVWWGTAKARS